MLYCDTMYRYRLRISNENTSYLVVSIVPAIAEVTSGTIID